MTECNREPLLFSSLNRQQIVADFDGGHLTSDGGGLLLREADRALELTRRLADCLADPRDPSKVIQFQDFSDCDEATRNQLAPVIGTIVGRRL